jgi:hypothetical protein
MIPAKFWTNPEEWVHAHSGTMWLAEGMAVTMCHPQCYDLTAEDRETMQDHIAERYLSRKAEEDEYRKVAQHSLDLLETREKLQEEPRRGVSPVPSRNQMVW